MRSLTHKETEPSASDTTTSVDESQSKAPRVIPRVKKPKVYTYVHRYNPTMNIAPQRTEFVEDKRGNKIGVPKRKVSIIFAGKKFSLTEQFAAKHDIEIETMRKMLESQPSFNREFYLLKGPGVKPSKGAIQLNAHNQKSVNPVFGSDGAMVNAERYTPEGEEAIV